MSGDGSRERRTGLRSTRDHCLLATALTLLHAGYLASLVVLDDFVAGYRFTGGDTFDYLRNAMALTGADLDATGRPPLLPLVMAALDSAGLLGWLPVLFVVAFQAFALMVFAELVATSRVAAWTAWGVLALGDSSLRWASLLEPSLLGGCLLAAAVLLLAGRWAEMLPPGVAPWLAGVAAGAAYLLHQLGLIFPAVAGLAFLLGRRRPAAWACLAFLPVPAVSLAVHATVYGGTGDAGVSHWGLLAWHADAAPAYLALGLTLLGLPLAATALAGTAIGLRVRDLTIQLSAATAALVTLFFVFFYDYTSRRFLLYLLPFSVLCAARAIVAIRPRGVAAAAGVLLVWTAMLPRSADDRQTAIPLLPGIDLEADVRLQPRDPGPIERLRPVPRSPAVFGRRSTLGRLRQDRHTPPPRWTPPPSETPADLYLLAPGEINTLARRSRVQVLLERRVHLVPLDVVEGILCALEPREAGDLVGVTVWRATLPDGRPTTLSHRADWRPLDGVDTGDCAPLTAEPDTAAAEIGATWSGRQVGLVIDRVDPRVGLALFSITGELVVVAPGKEPATRRLLRRAAGGRSDFETVIDGVTWRVLTYPDVVALL